MPKIIEYDNPDNKLVPSDRGSSAAAATGRRVGGFYREEAAGLSELARGYDRVAGSMDRVAGATRDIGADTARTGNRFAKDLEEGIKDVGRVAVAYADHREISHGAASYATMNQALTEKWNDTAKSADPNDPAVAKKFQAEVLEPQLQQFVEGFSTENSRKWAESQIASLRNHMFEKTSADMSLLAGDAVKVNVRQMSNSMSNTANSDPSSVDHLLKSVDSSVGAMVESSPNIRGTDSARVRTTVSEQIKEQIVKSGAIGAIAKSSNPEATAEAFGKKYPQYISGDELKMLAANARQQTRAQRIDEAYIGRTQEKEAQDKSDVQETRYRQAIYSDDPKQQAQVTAKNVINDQTLSLPAKKALITTIEREMKPETDAKMSAATSVDLFRKITDPNADPQKVRQAIYEARAKDPGTPGSLSKSDFTDAMKNLEDIKTPAGAALAQDRTEFFKRFAPTIDPSMGDASNMQFGHHTALGEQKMYLASKDARRLEADLKTKGQDPHSLYDPASPNFFGRPANLMKYRATMQEATEYQARLNEKTPGTNPPAVPKAGDVTQGYRFKGGDPSKQDSWEQVK